MLALQCQEMTVLLETSQSEISANNEMCQSLRT